MKSAQTPISTLREPVTITLTSEEHDIIVWALVSYHRCTNSKVVLDLVRKLEKESGDACRHPVQSPDAVGQGGTIYQLSDATLTVLSHPIYCDCELCKLNQFKDSTVPHHEDCVCWICAEALDVGQCEIQ